MTTLDSKTQRKLTTVIM